MKTYHPDVTYDLCKRNNQGNPAGIMEISGDGRIDYRFKTRIQNEVDGNHQHYATGAYGQFGIISTSLGGFGDFNDYTYMRG